MKKVLSGCIWVVRLDVLDVLVRLVGLVATGFLVVVWLLFSGEIGPVGHVESGFVEIHIWEFA